MCDSLTLEVMKMCVSMWGRSDGSFDLTKREIERVVGSQCEYVQRQMSLGECECEMKGAETGLKV